MQTAVRAAGGSSQCHPRTTSTQEGLEARPDPSPPGRWWCLPWALPPMEALICTKVAGGEGFRDSCEVTHTVQLIPPI